MKVKYVIAASAVFACASAANAQVAGSFILNAGWTHVTPQNTSSHIGRDAGRRGDNKSPVNPSPVDPGPIDPGPVDPSPVKPSPIDPGPVDPNPGKLKPIERMPNMPLPGEPIIRPPRGDKPPTEPLPGGPGAPGLPGSPPPERIPNKPGSDTLRSSMLRSEEHTVSSNVLPGSMDLSDLLNGGVKAESAAAFGLRGTYFITDNVAGELVLSTPTRHALKGTNGFGEVGNIGSIRMWSPALLLKYYLLNAEDKFRPYLGVGVSRTWFSKTYLELPGAVAGTTTLSLKDKWAPVFNGGFSYQFTDRLFGNVSVSYMPLKVAATTRTTLSRGGKTEVIYSSDKLKLNPVTTFVGLGYRF